MLLNWICKSKIKSQSEAVSEIVSNNWVCHTLCKGANFALPLVKLWICTGLTRIFSAFNQYSISICSQTEAASDDISGRAIEEAGLDVHIQFWNWWSNHCRVIQPVHFIEDKQQHKQCTRGPWQYDPRLISSNAKSFHFSCTPLLQLWEEISLKSNF